MCILRSDECGLEPINDNVRVAFIALCELVSATDFGHYSRYSTGPGAFKVSTPRVV